MSDAAHHPLAERLRPTTLAEVVGQQAALAATGPLGSMLAEGRLSSLILWGPPGVGKTTIARLLAAEAGLRFRQLSAIFSGVADLKKLFTEADALKDQGGATLLFVDEIHRFNKAQQDAFLPVMEDGTVILVGATTENPSFALNAALLSRAQIIVLERLGHDGLEALLARAEAAIGKPLPLTDQARQALLAMADGDGRALLGMAENLAEADQMLDAAALASRLAQRPAQYDRAGDQHYNLISALHKSVRGSDADAALYWFSRMLAGGEDPHFIARRLVRMAVEDIALADPHAMTHALHAWQTYERLGSPEGELALANTVVYLALAPKSNAAYGAAKAAMRAARQHGSAPPPKHILNAPTKMMRELGYGEGYAYDHNAEDGFSGQDYFPETMARMRFYQPVERGFERDLSKRLAWFDRLRAKRRGQETSGQ